MTTHRSETVLKVSSAKLGRKLMSIIDRFMGFKQNSQYSPFIESLEQRQLMYNAVADSVALYENGDRIDSSHYVFTRDTVNGVAKATVAMDARSAANYKILRNGTVIYEGTLTNTSSKAKTFDLSQSFNFTAVAGVNKVEFYFENTAKKLDTSGSFTDSNTSNNAVSPVSFSTRTTDLSISSIRLVDADNNPVTKGTVGQRVYIEAVLARTDVVSKTSVLNAFTSNGYMFPDFTWTSIPSGEGTQTLKSASFVLKAGSNTYGFHADVWHNLREVNESNNSSVSGSLNVVVDAPPTAGVITGPGATTSGPVNSINVSFSEAIDINSFNWNSVALTRNDGANLIDATTGAGLTLTLVDEATHTYAITGLGDLTKVAGSYSFTIVDDGLRDLGGNTLDGSASVDWNLIGVVPSNFKLSSSSEGIPGSGKTSSSTPTFEGSGTPGSTIQIFEGENVVGTGIVGDDGKFSVTLSTALSDGVHALTTRAVTSIDGIDYVAELTTPLNIDINTTPDKMTVITPFSGAQVVPVTTVRVVLSSNIDASTFSAADLTLTLDGNAISTDGMTVVPAPEFGPGYYKITIPAALTTAPGLYELGVVGAGIKNQYGSAIANDIKTSWEMKVALQTVTTYSGPLAAPLTQTSVKFTVPINLATFTKDDVILRRNGVIISNAGIIIGNALDLGAGWYRVAIPAESTTPPGAYSIEYVGAGIQDSEGRVVANNKTATWATLTKTEAVTTVTTPQTAAVTGTQIKFSTPIDMSTFTTADLILKRDGVTLSTDGITIAAAPDLGDGWYRVNIPQILTVFGGDYTLEYVASGIKDMNGNTVGNNLTTSWTMMPTVLSVAIYPQAINKPLMSTTVWFSAPIDQSTFTLDDVVLKRSGTVIPTTGMTITAAPDLGVGWFRITMPAASTTISGAYTLDFIGAGIQDTHGRTVANTMTTKWAMLPAIQSVATYSGTLASPLLSTAVRFTGPVKISTLTAASIVLKRNGEVVPLTGVTFSEATELGTAWYRVHLPAALTAAPGVYTLEYLGAGIQDYNGIAVSNNMTTTFTRV